MFISSFESASNLGTLAAFAVVFVWPNPAAAHKRKHAQAIHVLFIGASLAPGDPADALCTGLDLRKSIARLFGESLLHA
jgi:hypothetical protein